MTQTTPQTRDPQTADTHSLDRRSSRRPNPSDGDPRGTARRLPVRRVLPVGILAVAIVGFVILRATGPETPAPQAQERQWPVAAIDVAPSRQTPAVVLFARVQHPAVQTLTTRIDGDVVTLPVRPGQRVAAGDTLIELDPRDAEDRVTQRLADLEDARAALDLELGRRRNDERAATREREQVAIAARALERAEDLRRRQLASDDDVDQARNALESARLRLEAREQALRDAPARLRQIEARIARAESALALAQRDRDATTRRADAAGRVLSVDVAPGDTVRANATLMRLLPDDGLELVATLPNRVVAPVRAALASGTRLDVFEATGRTRLATLDRIAAEVKPGETGVRAFFAVDPEAAARLLLDETLSVRLELPPVDDALRIPREALFDGDRVFLIVDGRLHAQPVEHLGDARPLDRTIDTPSDGGARAILVRPLTAPADHHRPAPHEPFRILTTRLPNAAEGLAVRVVEPRP